jgi:hypothetical protein
MTPLKEMPHLLLWHLVVKGGEEFVSELIDTPKANRTVLVREGLVVEDKRVKPGAKRKIKSPHLSVTDHGWHWCQANMTWPKNARSTKAAKVLELLLPRLYTILQRQESVHSLGDFISKSTPPQPPPKADVHQAIRDACKALSNGQEGVRLRIVDVRARVNGFSKDEVTEALWDLCRKGEISLYQLDDPREIQPADREAAVLTSTNEEKHILYFGGMAS